MRAAPLDAATTAPASSSSPGPHNTNTGKPRDVADERGGSPNRGSTAGHAGSRHLHLAPGSQTHSPSARVRRDDDIDKESTGHVSENHSRPVCGHDRLVCGHSTTCRHHQHSLARHKQAMQASRAAACARSQSSYWQMHTRLFARPGQFLPEQLLAHARELGLDMGHFATCLSAGSTSDTDVDRALGQRLGVSVTPTFFMGRIVGDEVEIKWKPIGAQPIEAFREIIARVSRDE